MTKDIPAEVLAGEPTTEYDIGDFLEVPASERKDADDNPPEEENTDAFYDYSQILTPGPAITLSTADLDDMDGDEYEEVDY